MIIIDWDAWQSSFQNFEDPSGPSLSIIFLVPMSPATNVTSYWSWKLDYAYVGYAWSKPETGNCLQPPKPVLKQRHHEYWIICGRDIKAFFILIFTVISRTFEHLPNAWYGSEKRCRFLLKENYSRRLKEMPSWGGHLCGLFSSKHVCCMFWAHFTDCQDLI